MMIYYCCTPERAKLVRAHPVLNGIESIEVLDDDAPLDSPPQRTLLVRCFKPLAALSAANVRIEGGLRVRDVRAEWAFVLASGPGTIVLTAAEAAFLATLEDPERLLVVRTDSHGDFSRYALRLVAGPNSLLPPPNFDRLLSEIAFSFKADCPTPLDCLPPAQVCGQPPGDIPPMNYLARDYASFRRLVLDRLSLLVPDWRERRAADQGVMLAELLAYLGDALSYRQDVVGTEAYLGTARRRVSVRRHARLVDYFMHDGCNARAWVHVAVATGTLPLPLQAQFLTRSDEPTQTTIQGQAYEAALRGGSQAFETLDRVLLFTQHNQISLYTWGDSACILPKGATSATLVDGLDDASRLRLRVGDLLWFEEVRGPRTGDPADADISRRQVVRLTSVQPEATPVLDQLSGLEIDRIPSQPQLDALTLTPIVEIAWHEEDALPFPLCVSTRLGDGPDAPLLEVSVARGNLCLVDHGRTLPDLSALEDVPGPRVAPVPPAAAGPCEPQALQLVPARYRPRLPPGTLTQAARVRLRSSGGVSTFAAFDPLGSAASAMRWDIRHVLPQVALNPGPLSWTPQRELLDSGAFDRHFVVEVENDSEASLRFGDGEHGRRPAEGEPLSARLRIGNGAAGNVGTGAIAHLVLSPDVVASPLAIQEVRNPWPARGGREPETIEQVRKRAPYAFRTLERAVTMEDYHEVTLRHAGLQRASARMVWTGSWHTVSVSVDPEGGETADSAEIARSVRDHLERYRLAGYDLRVEPPVYVSLEIELRVCLKPGYYRGAIEGELMALFSSGALPGGGQALFHPERLSFGEPVYLSPLYAAALGVEGISHVHVTLFRRQGKQDDGKALADGQIRLSRREIARLDNDRSYPERGTFRALFVGAA